MSPVGEVSLMVAGVFEDCDDEADDAAVFVEIDGSEHANKSEPNSGRTCFNFKRKRLQSQALEDEHRVPRLSGRWAFNVCGAWTQL